jgi:LysM repeat protein
MLGIAFQYQITLEELMAANPEVKPNQMSIGTGLVIPGTAESSTADETPDAHPTPTALPVDLGPIFCAQTREGGAWCSQLIHNPHDFALEGLSGIFRLVDQENQAVTSQTGFLPLDLIQPGQNLPISVFFPPPIPSAYQASAEIISSLPNPQDGRYLPVKIEDQEVAVAENGLSARVTFTLSLDRAETAATRIRAAAIAYDQQGRVVGIRRWERTQDLQLNPGETLSVELTLYSQSGPIQRVEISAESRP